MVSRTASGQSQQTPTQTSTHKSASSYFQRWFANRAPRQDSVKLNLRNVYIFFSREGALFALLLIITFIAGINYANNLVLGLCFYLISIWVISFHLTFAHVMGLNVQLLEVTMAAAGEPVWVTLKISSESGKPRRQLSFRFDHSHMSKEEMAIQLGVSETVAGHPSRLLLPSLSGEQIIKLPVFTQCRGRLELPRLIISSVYPLGIMRAWSYVYFATPAWVYPAPIKFEWETQYAMAKDEEANQSMYATEGQNDFEQLDNYIEGQSLARVSWAHVARGQGMLTKHFADPIGRELRLDYADMPALQHEQKLSQMVFALQSLAQSPQAFQVILPDDGAGEIGQGDSFVKASLLRLAKVR